MHNDICLNVRYLLNARNFSTALHLYCESKIVSKYKLYFKKWTDTQEPQVVLQGITYMHRVVKGQKKDIGSKNTWGNNDRKFPEFVEEHKFKDSRNSENSKTKFTKNHT